MTFVLAAQAATIPTQPVITVGTPTNTSLTITLTTPSVEPVFGLDGYDVELSSNGGATWTRIAIVVDLPYIVGFLTAGTTYQLRVRGASNAAGGYRSAASPVVSATTTGGGPPPPGRRYFDGWYVAIRPSDQSGNPTQGIPNGGTVTGTYPNNVATGGVVSNAGPVCSGVSAVVLRHNWNDIDNGDGTYNWAPMDKEIAQARGLNVAVFWMIILRTFDGRPNATPPQAPTNPMPSDLTAYADFFVDSANTNLTGEQGYRWSPVVIQRFQTFCNAVGARYDLDPNFGGLATQETATGGANGKAISHGTGNYTVGLTNGLGNFVSSDVYNTANYGSALAMEARIVAAACPHARHLLYSNFVQGDNTPATLLTVAIVAQPLGAIWGGPDLVTDAEPGNINGRCYPNYTKYHNGTNGIAHPGPTFCSIQSAEWTGVTPAQKTATPSPNPCMRDLYNWMTSSNVYAPIGGGNVNPRDHRPASPSPSPLNLDICVVDWAHNGSPQFNDTLANGGIVPIIAAHPSFGTVTPNP